MNYKKANWSFLGMVLLHFAATIVLMAVSGFYSMGMTTNLLVSELLLVIPAGIALISSKEKPNRVLGFHRIKLSSILMIMLYTILISPLTTLLNAISMLFVDNAVTSMSGEVLKLPFWLMFFMMAIWGPVCEEFCFRGVIYRGYLKSGNALGAVLLSSLLFGLIHLNFNQAPYAFAIGVAMALLVEATGSLLSSIVVHVMFNAQSVVLMYVYDRFMPEIWELQASQSTGIEEMLPVICVYSVLAVICTALAGCVLVWLVKNQGRQEYISWLWKQRKNGRRGRLVSVPLIIGIILCLCFMLLTAL